MRPIPFKESNLNLGAGNNPNTVDMPISVSRDSEDIPFLVSCWKLSPEELAEVYRTGEAWLGIMGHTPPPPVMLMGFHPFKHHGFTFLDLTK